LYRDASASKTSMVALAFYVQRLSELTSQMNRRHYLAKCVVRQHRRALRVLTSVSGVDDDDLHEYRPRMLLKREVLSPSVLR
jgi:hypothetical protein